MDECKFVVQNEFGEEIECEVLFTYQDERTGKHYIAYTDDSLDEEGNTSVYASIYDPDTDPAILHPIETEEEWETVETILASLQEDDYEDELAEVEASIAELLNGKTEEEIEELKKLFATPLDEDEE